MVVLNEVLKHGYHLLHNNRGGHLLHEFGQVGSSLAADHGCVIVDQLAKLLPELRLDGRRDLGIRCLVKTACRDPRSEPVGLGKADGEGDEVFLDLLGRELGADLVQRLDSLQNRGTSVSPRPSPIFINYIYISGAIFACAYLVTDNGLLDSREVLKRGEQHMTPLRTANVLDEAPELLAKGDENFVFVLDGLCRPGRGRVSDRRGVHNPGAKGFWGKGRGRG